MYVPKQFREERREVLIAAMRDIRLCTLVTARAGGIEATHVPVVLSDDGGRLTLECHVARGNAHWRAAAGASETLAIFQGPHAYVSPSWYASKKEHGKVVPTWNYVVVHAHGTLSTMDTGEEHLAHLRSLTVQNEHGRAQPWSIDDAPEDFIRNMTKAIVGIRLKVERIEGSWKLIQHKPEADRHGVVEGLAGEKTGNAHSIAALMRAAEAARESAK
jgi:transcriptional regulator